MPDFDLDHLKATWQKQDPTPKYQAAEIQGMLNRRSRNYVKYILGISILEFFIFLLVSVYYLFVGNEGESFFHLIERLGVKKTPKIESDLENLYTFMRVVSLAMTAFFVFKFYQNYKRIKVESNLKKFISQIIVFKKTVNLFIAANIVLLVLLTVVLAVFVVAILRQQNVHLENPTMVGFAVGILVSLLFCLALLWLYYRIVYGIIMKRLTRNMEQLKTIEQQ